jgi:hypothetical protein
MAALRRTYAGLKMGDGNKKISGAQLNSKMFGYSPPDDTQWMVDQRNISW